MAISYHDILGVRKGAGTAEIKRAYRRKAMQYHPDKNPSPQAMQKFILITEAYEGLLAGKSYRFEPRVKAKEEPQPTRRGHAKDPKTTAEEIRERVRAAHESQRRATLNYYKRYKKSLKHHVSMFIAVVSIVLGVLLVLDVILPYDHQEYTVDYKYSYTSLELGSSGQSGRFFLGFDAHEVPVTAVLYNFAQKNDQLVFKQSMIFGQVLEVDRLLADGKMATLPLSNMIHKGLFFYLFLLFLPVLRWVIERPHVSYYFFDFSIRTGILVTVCFVSYQLWGGLG